jgi:hypothetical protein
MLTNLLEQHKATIVAKWIKIVKDSYSSETAQFLKAQNDPFSNPVGNIISTGLTSLFELLLKGAEQDSARSVLDPVLRIRAIQSFTPSQATNFLFSLKTIIKEVLGDEFLKDKTTLDDWFVLETKIDHLIQIGFDIYMECLTKLYEIKATEMKKRTFSAFERAGLVKDN